MASDTNTSLRVKSLNFSPGNSNLAGLGSTWSNTGKGDNLYSPTIIPFYTGVISLPFIYENGVNECDFTSDIITTIPLGKNIITGNVEDNTNPFTLMYKTIEVFVCTIPKLTDNRFRNFVYKTQLTLTLGEIFLGSRVVSTDSTLEKEVQQGTYAPQFFPPPIDITLGSPGTGLVMLSPQTSGTLTPPGNQGLKAVAIIFDNNLDNLDVDFRLRIKASTTAYENFSFSRDAAFKGYIKIS